MIDPVHPHPCQRCKFLGGLFESATSTHYDLYYCESSRGVKSLIARCGAEDNYQSGMLSALEAEKRGDINQPLVHALQRARAKGYLPLPREIAAERLKRVEKENADLRERVHELEQRLDNIHQNKWVQGSEIVESKGSIELRRILLTEDAKRMLCVNPKG